MAAVNLRELANGRPCILCGRVDGTTVLHHLRVGQSGMGQKPPDIDGVDVCAGCHAHFHGEGRADYRGQLQAHLRQIKRWLSDGVLRWG